MTYPEFADIPALSAALDAAGYLPDEGVATAAYLAIRMRRPLLLEGDPGVGKTALAQALADVAGAELVRLSCYEGIDASQALYDWDFPRQLLHLRAAEDGGGDERSVYDRRFLIARPILRALEVSPAVLLVDEIDRADDEFEAFLLEVLADNAVTIPELGTIRPAEPPIVVLTSNRTRELHDALKRRCLYHWVDHPDLEREVEIIRRHQPEVADRLARQVAAGVAAMRDGRAGEAAGDRRGDRLGDRAAAARGDRAEPAGGAGDAGGAAEVPRGPGDGRARRAARAAGPAGVSR